MIPWLVILLLFIVIGEFGHDINHFIHNMGLHEWQWLNNLSDFVHHHHTLVLIIDNIIIAFFAIDLYFNFFKSPTFWIFLRKNFIDILAVLPLGLVIGHSAKLTTEAQEVTHVAVDSEKLVGKSLKGTKTVTKGARIARLITRLPRFFRVLRLRDFLRRKSRCIKLLLG